MAKAKNKKKKKDFKYWVGQAHLWLGLASGLIVLLLGITGCLYAFSEEITSALRSDEIYVKEIKETRLPPSELWKIAQQAIGKDKPLNSINIYSDPAKSVRFYTYAGSEGHLFYFDNIDHYLTAYVNPYTGEVLGIYDEEMDFFNIIKMLHWSLLLDTPIGQPITGWATFIFVVMLITGIILWWPKNKAARKQRLWFQWKDSTKWRRKNYDLHNIFGFYISTIAIIVAFTGMVWAFTWFQATVYVVGSQSISPPEIITEKSTFTDMGDKDAAFNKAYAVAKEKHADAGGYSFAYPADSLAAIDVYVQQYEGRYYVNHNMQFDQYTGKFLRERLHDEKNFGEKLIAANYDIHVGAILGLPGKILAFIISFVCAMLPVTGFLIWWGRTNKKSKKI
jgi:uncharacterized iron-regulated membrane protein